MFIIKGKYNIARIMLPDWSYLDEETTKQIYSFLNHPAFKGEPIVIMPDTHAGKGSVIGFTMPLNNYVIPNVVGVDIGCGMLMTKIPDVNFSFERFDDFIKENIPSGHSIHSDTNKTRKEYLKRLPLDSYKTISEKVDQNVHVVNSLGTLGGGNHFIEIDIDKDNNKWLIIHSGSRNFGLKVCEYHQKKAKTLMNDMFIGDAYRNQEFLPIDKGGSNYLGDMSVVQEYAHHNRNLMMYIIMNYFFKYSWDTGEDQTYECVHNYIGRDNIIRKGAISAYKDEKVIIPLNMKDGVIIGKGKENKEWNFSAPHGAGRILSRKKAKESINIEDVKKLMEGIYTTSINKNTLDEAPQAYKDYNMILDMVKDTIEVEFIMKPVYNFKAGEE